jgi:S1-C subfamily serine protease
MLQFMAVCSAFAEDSITPQIDRVRGLSNTEICNQVRSRSTPESDVLRELKIRGLTCSDIEEDAWDYSPEATGPSTSASTNSANPIGSKEDSEHSATASQIEFRPEPAPPENKSTAVEDSVIRVSSGNTVGSGFYIDPTHVVTNAHVVGNASLVTLARSTGAPYPGRVFYRNSDVDFAIIETETQGSPVPIRKSEQTTGEGVMTLGYPQGRMTLAASTGTIRKIMPCCIIHDALIAAGSSGGPLVDQNREVLGLNTLISKTPGDATNSSDRGITVRLTYILQMLIGNIPGSLP